MTRLHWLIVNGAILMACAVFDSDWFDSSWRNFLLTGLMLLLPFVDRQWKRPVLNFNQSRLILWNLLLAIVILIVAVNAEYKYFVLSTLVLTALPEEWFFRTYYMSTIQSLCNRAWLANIITSALFALLHTPSQGLIGLAVFIPSLFYGWLYQRTNDLILLILLHTLSNLTLLILSPIYFQ